MHSLRGGSRGKQQQQEKVGGGSDDVLVVVVVAARSTFGLGRVQLLAHVITSKTHGCVCGFQNKFTRFRPPGHVLAHTLLHLPGGCSGLTVLTCPSGPFASAASTIAWLGSPASLAGFRFDATHTI